MPKVANRADISAKFQQWQVVDAVDVPVIAAGGFADSRGMAAAFALGASAIQMGSRFVLSNECIAHENYKNFVLKAKDRSTVVTGRSLGHPVRVLANKLTRTFHEMEEAGASPEELEKLGEGTLHLATHKGDVENGSVMIGQISGMLMILLTVCLKPSPNFRKNIFNLMRNSWCVMRKEFADYALLFC